MALDSKIETPRVVIDDGSDEWDFKGTYKSFPTPQPEVDSDEFGSEVADKEFEITGQESDRKGRAKKSPKKRPSTVAQAKAPKLRPTGDILHRIRWDPSLKSGDFVLGYIDRFEGLKEMPVDLWLSETTEEDFVPQHRIQYFKRVSDGTKVWDREQRIDLVFGSGLGSDSGSTEVDEKEERAESAINAKGSAERTAEELGS